MMNIIQQRRFKKLLGDRFEEIRLFAEFVENIGKLPYMMTTWTIFHSNYYFTYKDGKFQRKPCSFCIKLFLSETCIGFIKFVQGKIFSTFLWMLMDWIH